ncbi:isopentenyl-diphosphate Delta-isomerase [Blattabacterium cuenoti]|uniref:isopentenyl-diphosphate Delta-isomerase n=1 Tax=Blattabacterium cuenoti TaxID=1653831 RepID=UPI00163B6CB9|nr:NUDIX domain-containing protein [Blattabacterium cuenoti]
MVNNQNKKIDKYFIPLLNKKNNKIIGFDKKENIHKKGLLHSAVSVFIFNKKNNLMLQKRSSKKYHSSLLWTNTSCSHPNKHESILNAAHRCLKNEMGFDCKLQYKFCFTYCEIFNNGLIENELDHVFIGYYEKNPIINHEEVESWKWINLNKLLNNINVFSKSYTVWLKIILNKYIKKLTNNIL